MDMLSGNIEEMRIQVANTLKGIERYNPDNLKNLEMYVRRQSQENAYDLEANLAVLKLYQFNQNTYNAEITCQILLKALTNFPHTDFILCKCLLTEKQCKESPISQIIYLADLLESCDFQTFWKTVAEMDIFSNIVGFHDSIRKFVCHVVGITFQTIDRKLLAQLLGGIDDNKLKQWIQKYGWREEADGLVFIVNQDEIIKTKNITEKIDFDTVAGIMAACR